MYLEIDNKMPDSENKDGKKDIVALRDKLAEISEVKDDGKNYKIVTDEDAQQATIIDLKMKVVVDVTIEDNIVKITSGITDDINNVLPPTIEYEIDPNEETEAVIVTIKITAREENQGIAKMQFPDNTEKPCFNQKKVEVEYKVSERGPYKFVVVGANGRRATQTIEIKNAKEAAKIVMEPDIETPTKDDFNMSITYDENPAYKGEMLTNEDKYQYKIGENGEWKTATENPTIIPIKENGYVYARYYNGTEGHKTLTHTIDNIDKEKPRDFELEATATANSITVSAVGNVTDKGSKGTAEKNIGIKGYQFQLKDEAGTTVIQDWIPEPAQLESSFTFTKEHGIEDRTKYKVSMRAIDLAGNIAEATNSDYIIETESAGPKVGDYVNYSVDVGEVTYDEWIIFDLDDDGSIELITLNGPDKSFGGTETASKKYAEETKPGPWTYQLCSSYLAVTKLVNTLNTYSEPFALGTYGSSARHLGTNKLNHSYLR